MGLVDILQFWIKLQHTGMKDSKSLKSTQLVSIFELGGNFVSMKKCSCWATWTALQTI